MKNLTLSILSIILLSCQKKQDIQIDEHKPIVTDKSTILSPENEIRKWKKELINNREIGPPCTDNMVQWQEDNPTQYYGLPSEIFFKIYDINDDSKLDYLLYFNPGDPCGGGNTYHSDLIKLVYSNEEDYLYNDDLTSKIHNKIYIYFYEKGIELYGEPIFIVEDFDIKISGQFKAWHNDDAHCCPRYTGSFFYNIINDKIDLNYSENQEFSKIQP